MNDRVETGRTAEIRESEGGKQMPFPEQESKGQVLWPNLKKISQARETPDNFLLLD